MRRRLPAEEAPRVVLDTNVVMDWLLFNDPSTAVLGACCRDGRLTWITTTAMLAELGHVLGQPTLVRQPDARERVLTCAARYSTKVDAPTAGAARRLQCSDPDDQMFIDLALARSAKWLLTRDKALLRLARPARAQGTLICTPAAWVFA